MTAQCTQPGAVRTTCPYCGVGCGVLATPLLPVAHAADGEQPVRIQGDPDHPANFGRLCSKGSALGETLGSHGRLLHPEIDGRQVDWDEALDLVAQTFKSTISEHGPDSVAFYVSGQLLTEDYYVANKLMKGFIGSANIDTNSRLCMASSVAGHRRAFGSDTVPGCYEDLELADLIILTGSNLAWCHPVLFQRIAAAKAQKPSMQVVLIDPRRTMTAELADMHLAIRPDGDTALFTGLLQYLCDNDHIDRAYIDQHTTGLLDALSAASRNRLSLSGNAGKTCELEHQTGLLREELAAFYQLFASTGRTVTAYSQGVNQSVSGTDKVNAIINCHLATGRIGTPGCGPFSLTGQPNAMGGREVGGMANMLAAHMDIDRPDHRRIVQDFWGSPRIADKPGLKAVDLFDAVADGRIKALWILATNPVDSMPDAGRVEAAIKACPFAVVSDVVSDTDTIRHAHVRLPSAAWGEKDGTVTNSERRISRQRAFLPLPGQARPDWWQLAQIGIRMGYPEAFSYAGPSAIFAEHAALSAAGNDGSRDFDIGAVADVNKAEFDELEPFQWPLPSNAAKHHHDSKRLFADGKFFTEDGRARFVAVEPKPARSGNAAFALTLNTGRVRDHWHTMTRTARSPRLSAHYAEPFCEIHPLDAARFDVAAADIVIVESEYGQVLVRALISTRQQQGSLFIPIHWTDQFAAAARVDRLIPPVTDPVSGQPALKNCAVRVRPLEASHFAFAVLANEPVDLAAPYWAKARCANGWRIEMAFTADLQTSLQQATSAIGQETAEASVIYEDKSTSQVRLAWFSGNPDGDHLVAALYFGSEPVAVSRVWAVEQLGAAASTVHTRVHAVAGRPGQNVPDRGPIVCACFGIGANEIRQAVRDGCGSVTEVGAKLSAGTNCGSCRSEISGLLRTTKMDVQATAEVLQSVTE